MKSIASASRDLCRQHQFIFTPSWMLDGVIAESVIAIVLIGC